jgi:hypothetical protein
VEVKASKGKQREINEAKRNPKETKETKGN